MRLTLMGQKGHGRRGRLVIHCLSNERIWIDDNPVVISDKLIDETEGRTFVRFGASIRIYRAGYKDGHRMQRLIIEAPRNIKIERDAVRNRRLLEA